MTLRYAWCNDDISYMVLHGDVFKLLNTWNQFLNFIF